MIVRYTAFLVRSFIAVFNFFAPLGDLVVRLFIATIFFEAGLVKLQSWDTTLSLFSYEYHVPFLSPYLAAVLGTAAELILPVLLVLGLGGRFCIFIFFLYNVIAVFSYPFLWTPEGAMGLREHINWGLLLMMLMLHGSGKWSLDHYLHIRHRAHLTGHSSKK